MADISFIHLASANKSVATSNIIKNVRKYHPNAYYFLASDGIDDLSEIAKTYNCDYKFYENRLGYLAQYNGYGYPPEKIVEWLSRLLYACQNCNTSHILMMEDDVWLLNSVTVEDSWEMACHTPTPGDNIIPEFVIDIAQQFSGVRAKTNQFGAGGGSIFKVSTFIENYDKIKEFILSKGEDIRSNYPPMGSLDVFMVVYYFLCGKEYTTNPHLIDAHSHKPGFDYEEFVGNLAPEIQIVNNYKKWYWNE